MLLLSLLAAVMGFFAHAMVSPGLRESQLTELLPFREAFGPTRNSQWPEEWLIRDFFRDRRNGFFLDVGANHYRKDSNTYYLDVELGWEGIAVEPLTEFAADYVRYRPRTRFRPYFVSDVSDEQARLYSTDRDDRVSSGVAEYVGRAGDALNSRDVPTITLDDLLTAEGVDHIDFLNMDIELWEPKGLAGFDIERFRPALVCIEAHVEVRDDVLDYFARHGYVVIGRYLRADIWNLYFRPLDPRPPAN
jgi:FkbM family methyltransferase